ncbi:MAG: NfeD family protein [Planctomycetota bacterium]
MSDMLTPSTIWLALGFALVALELASGAAVLIFCGLGALAVGALLAAGATLSTPWQIVLAATAAPASAFVLRPLLLRSFRYRHGYLDHVGAAVVVETPVTDQAAGTVRHRGAAWQARAVHGESLSSGERGIVAGVEGIELIVRRE